MTADPTQDDYDALLSDLSERIGQARVRAALSVNRELVELYWHIGREILARQQLEGWGAKTLDRLSRDLRQAFPEMKGLSRRNLLYMRSVAKTFAADPDVPQLVAQIPWGHNRLLVDKISDRDTYLWYATQTVANGWSRSTLAQQIRSRLHERQGAALTNFADTLPTVQSELAQELINTNEPRP